MNEGGSILDSNVPKSKPRHLFILTGAGVSAESGVKTFRDEGGLWEGHRIEEVACPIAWKNNPDKVWEFYQLRRNQLLEVEPNPTHRAIARLQTALGPDRCTLVTQNVDDLHERGGSSEVIHMHGELRNLLCSKCGFVSEMMSQEHLSKSEYVACQDCGNTLRPDIVWFGEMPYHMSEIYSKIEQTDLMLVVGTSGHVYPAASLLPMAEMIGAYTVGVNYDAPENVVHFSEFHRGKSGELLPELVESWLANWGLE